MVPNVKTHFEQIPLDVVKKIIGEGKAIEVNGDKAEKLKPRVAKPGLKTLRAR
jgi:hypothetical protein